MEVLEESGVGCNTVSQILEVFPEFLVVAQWCIGLRVTSLTFDFEFSDAENCWIREGAVNES